MPDTGTAYNWRMPLGDDFFKVGFQAVRDMAADIAATIAGQDGGWVALTTSNVTLLNSWTLYTGSDAPSGPRYRIIRNRVELQFSGTSPSGLALTGDATGNIADTDVATLPTVIRPTGNTAWGMFGRMGFILVAGCSVNPAGTLQMRSYLPNQAVPANAPTVFTLSYLLG